MDASRARHLEGWVWIRSGALDQARVAFEQELACLHHVPAAVRQKSRSLKALARVATRQWRGYRARALLPQAADLQLRSDDPLLRARGASGRSMRLATEAPLEAAAASRAAQTIWRHSGNARLLSNSLIDAAYAACTAGDVATARRNLDEVRTILAGRAQGLSAARVDPLEQRVRFTEGDYAGVLAVRSRIAGDSGQLQFRRDDAWNLAVSAALCMSDGPRARALVQAAEDAVQTPGNRAELALLRLLADPPDSDRTWCRTLLRVRARLAARTGDLNGVALACLAEVQRLASQRPERASLLLATAFSVAVGPHERRACRRVLAGFGPDDLSAPLDDLLLDGAIGAGGMGAVFGAPHR